MTVGLGIRSARTVMIEDGKRLTLVTAGRGRPVVRLIPRQCEEAVGGVPTWAKSKGTASELLATGSVGAINGDGNNLISGVCRIVDDESKKQHMGILVDVNGQRMCLGRGELSEIQIPADEEAVDVLVKTNP